MICSGRDAATGEFLEIEFDEVIRSVRRAKSADADVWIAPGLVDIQVNGFAGVDFKVPLFWIALAYFLHSVGELCLSPVGLSMITKLSIARVVGMMMGVWFLSTAMAQYVAGVVAQFASVETVGGQVTNLKVSLDTYVGVFQTIGLASIAIGVFLLAIAPLLKRWMHGVR